MRSWILFYLAGYSAYSIWAHISDFQKSMVSRWSVVELIGNLFVMIPALAYWYPQITSFFGQTLVLIFIFGVLSLLTVAGRATIKNFRDIELPLSAKWSLSIFSTMLLTLVVSPLLWWGSQNISKYF